MLLGRTYSRKADRNKLTSHAIEIANGNHGGEYSLARLSNLRLLIYRSSVRSSEGSSYIHSFPEKKSSLRKQFSIHLHQPKTLCGTCLFWSYMINIYIKLLKYVGTYFLARSSIFGIKSSGHCMDIKKHGKYFFL